MSSESRVIVVGTTADYVSLISRLWPGRALFLTQKAHRLNAREESPPPADEVLADLADYSATRRALSEHMRMYNIQPVGITCYDCESMPLAAEIATWLSLPYHSSHAIELCRDKDRCKNAWRAEMAPCPRSAMVTNVEEALEFFSELSGDCVIKPLSGTGSELVFRCANETELREAVEKISLGLSERSHNRIYAISGNRMISEEYVSGPEYSCDFLIDDGRVRIIRVARKIAMHDGPFGVIRGYLVPGVLPDGYSLSELGEIAGRAARALHIVRAICMVDFIVSDDGLKLLELAPRPGGDCLPQIIRHASGMDILGAALNFAEGWPLDISEDRRWLPTVGLRLYAKSEGVLDSVDLSELSEDPRVLETSLLARPGDVIVMPPEDYDSWVLGHVIFRPDPDRDLDSQCDELLDKVCVIMKHGHNSRLSLGV